MADMNDIIYYVPIHSNLSQTEHTAAFFEHNRAKLFLYDWNTAKDLMIAFYSAQTQWKLDLFIFSLEAVFHELTQDSKANARVVILLTSSPNYSFGVAQKAFFVALQKHFPNIIDIVPIGHCMYGCQSCGIHEHNVPVYFTRFAKHQLPYSTSDVKKVIDTQLKSGPKFKNTKYPTSVLIAPSVGSLSFLSNDYIIDCIIEAQKNLNMVFMVKLHNFCFLENHPLSGISPIEKANIEKLKKHFVIIDQTQYCILPMLDAFDVIVTDVDSSVAFESLYFHPKIVLAYHTSSQEMPESEYTQYLRLFSDDFGLTKLLSELNAGNQLETKDGREFFQKKYGVVGGNEVSRIASSRKWSEKVPPKDAPLPKDEPTVATDIQTYFDERKKVSAITGADFLAMGMQVPPPMAAFDRFVAIHKLQMDSIGLPERLWMIAFEKLSFELFDAGDAFELHYDEGYRLVMKKDMEKESGLYLVDHAWTTDYQHARNQLKQMPQLLERMYNLMDLDAEDQVEEEEGEEGGEEGKVEEGKEEKEGEEENDEEVDEVAEEVKQLTVEEINERIDKVWNRMWKYNQTYKVMDSTGSDQSSVWYVMDEVGSGIQHSENPNFRCQPFLYLSDPAKGLQSAIAFSLLWPMKDVKEGDEVTRDYIGNTHDPEQRKARLSAFKDELREEFKYTPFTPKPPVKSVKATPSPTFDTKKELGLFTDTEIIKKNIKFPQFKIVDSMDKADIIWMSEEFKFFPFLKPHQRVNQFPNETCVTFKHRLAETIYRSYGEVEWFPTTYNLETQMPQFIADYMKRSKENKNNHWMVKPWNAARSLDSYISDNLSCLLRMSETGPKIITKYIENPVTYEGRKFDLRYCVLLKSVEPFEVYVYNYFWIRLANVQYGLTDFENYEKHFTVMNYTPHNMTQLMCPEFMKGMESQYNIKWEDVQKKINEMCKKVFQAAVANDAPYGISPYPQSGAMYGIDLMLDQGFEPKILEVNFSPDITRACWDEHYCDKLFTVLFLNEKEGYEPAWSAVTKL